MVDAHEDIEKCFGTLLRLGFDIAHVNDGYGFAFGFVMDGVIDALNTFNTIVTLLGFKR